MEQGVETIKYEFDRLMAVIPISDKFWANAAIPTLEIAKSAHERFMRAIITWEVAKRRLAEYQWPATWWDAFKERWFPAWAKRRWPVRYKKVAVDELIAGRRYLDEDELVRYFLNP